MLLKLAFHTVGDGVYFNTCDLPDVKPCDILELSQVQNGKTIKLLVKIKENSQNVPVLAPRRSISISKALGKRFDMVNSQDVNIKVVLPEEYKDYALQHAELVFKDQYYSRSDMLRLRAGLMDAVLHHEEKVEILEMRAQVEELWHKNSRVSCGIVTKETRVSFRSQTSQVHIFIQMSCEMWAFDEFGQLYLEKAVDGYLYDLFHLWKEKGCAHDVSITLFSRVFYDAKSLEDFPTYMRECVRKDYANRFYEDYYRVVVQNERYENWFKTIGALKAIFTTYDTDVLHFHEKYTLSNTQFSGGNTWNPVAAMGIRSRERSLSEAAEIEQNGYSRPVMEGRLRSKSVNITALSNFPSRPPVAWNSSASEGNFLEVMNMALNVYEKFYMDRCFERTGKMSIVISPGIGVFDVNRELMNITKQRSIDIGSCCDLVCLGQRPLYDVPLFKINQDRSHYFSGLLDEDYNIPHWLTLSYYTSKIQIECKLQGKQMLDSELLENILIHSSMSQYDFRRGYSSSPMNAGNFQSSGSRKIREDMPVIDYEDYDDKVFKYHSKTEQQEKFSYLLHGSSRNDYGKRRERVSYTISTNGLFCETDRLEKSITSSILGKQLDEMAENFLSHSYCGRLPEEQSHSAQCRRMAGSVTIPYGHYRRQGKLTSSKWGKFHRATKALVNPFTQSKTNFKATSNRRRWAHAHPVESSGHGHASRSANNVQQMSKSTIAKGNASPSRESLFSETSSAQPIPTPAIQRLLAPRQHHLSECSENGFAPGSFAESPSRGHLRNDSFCLTEFSANNLGNPFSQTESSSSLASSCNDIYGSLIQQHAMASGRYFQHSSRQSHILEKDILNYESRFGNLDSTLPVNATIDWKAMTRPPILPITTDYFPDKQTLDKHFLFSEYTLIAEEIELQFSGIYGSRHSPTLREIFNEMIYQRVAQGYQIVIVSKSQQIAQTGKKSAFHKLGTVKTSPGTSEEVILSMGRLFHLLTLHEKDIVVRRYCPRHNLNRCSYDYTYRFQVPDSFYFDSSLTCFKTDPLESYNWNSVDHHLLAQGGEAQGFLEAMKFWRSRFVLLPTNNSGQKKIMDGSEFCNVYEPKTSSEKQALIDGFLKFMEHLNSIKKAAQFLCRRKDKRPPERTSGETSSQSLTGLLNKPVEQSPRHFQYTYMSPRSEVVKGMMDPTDGLNFVVSQLEWVTLPKYSFISADAVSWLMKNVKGINSVGTAVRYMQQLVEEKLVCHASEKLGVSFVYGFKIFFILPEMSMMEPLNNSCLSLVEQNFMEVEILTGNEDEALARRRNTQPASLLREIRTSFLNPPLFKHIRLDIPGKSERQEWGVLKHHLLYTPTCAFEMSAEWLVATGSVLGELINGWARKAAACSLHMVPAPADPFALPFEKQSDPLRGPIYIPMDVDCLELDGGLFCKFQKNPYFGQLYTRGAFRRCCTMEHSWSQKINQSQLLNFQDSILKSFGFIRDKCVTALTLSEDYNISKNDELPKYIHSSGGMHIMVVSTLSRRADHHGSLGRGSDKGEASSRVISGQYEDFVIRQYNKQVGVGKSTTHTVGFLWAWNFMLTKKWMNQQTGNEIFQDNILMDLRRFCGNSENRLKVAWDEFKKYSDTY